MLPWEGKNFKSVNQIGYMLSILFDKDRVLIANIFENTLKFEGVWGEEEKEYYKQFRNWKIV